MQIPDQIEREIVIDAPVERVWTLITESEHFGTWFADAGAEIDLRPGGAMTLRSTLVEFSLAAEGDGTRVRVVEIGFAGLDTSDLERRRQLDDNTEGWGIQLGNLSDYARRVAA